MRALFREPRKHPTMWLQLFAGCFLILVALAWAEEFMAFTFAALGISLLAGGSADLLPIGWNKLSAGMRIIGIAFAVAAILVAVIGWLLYT